MKCSRLFIQKPGAGPWKLYEEAIGQKLFVPLNPKMMVQMHYGTIVYVLKAHLQGNFELTGDSVHEIIRSCWKAVQLDTADKAE
jgi:hypothetical protein